MTLVAFDLLVPRTDDKTGLVHPPSRFETWALETTERFGGLTQLGADILGFWFDRGDLIEDHSHWYRVAVKPEEVEAFRTRDGDSPPLRPAMPVPPAQEAELVSAEPAV